MEAAARLHQATGPFSWWREADARAHRAFLAASFGWMLDAFDVMLFSLVLVPLMRDLNLTRAQGGALNSITLLAAAAGGLIFGVLVDRYGRTRALMGSVLLAQRRTVLTKRWHLELAAWHAGIWRSRIAPPRSFNG